MNSSVIVQLNEQNLHLSIMYCLTSLSIFNIALFVLIILLSADLSLVAMNERSRCTSFVYIIEVLKQISIHYILVYYIKNYLHIHNVNIT